MSDLIKYSVAGLVLVGVCLLLAWPFLAAEDFQGLAAAAAVAYPVQVVAFGLMLRFRDRTNAFLAVWLGGSIVRFGLVLVVALLLIRYAWVPTAPTLLGLAGLLFALLLLEPFFFRPTLTGAAQAT